MNADLVAQLQDLGSRLDVDDAALADRVVAALDGQPRGLRRRATRRRLLIAAAVVAVVAVGGAVAVPSSRQTLARWFGLDGVNVVVDPALPSVSPPPVFDMPGPGESKVMVIDGRQILVSAVAGSMSRPMISKTIANDNQLHEVDVRGQLGLWIAGEAHQVMYESAGEIRIERAAANTLLWNDGSTLYRVEGFDDVEDAVAFAERR
ncbi:MAG TPA: hypothetical protein PKV27_03990 [Ilumatobacteraceae bacterium]|nr:hypothetical protein [Ilumatobacteraceae bacterium]